jgi:hypothetical protein
VILKKEEERQELGDHLFFVFIVINKLVGVKVTVYRERGRKMKG